MNLEFHGEKELAERLSELTEELHFRLAPGGLMLTAHEIGGDTTTLRKQGKNCEILYHKKSAFFYALAKLLAAGKGNFEQKLMTQGTSLGVMLDCSRNAVLRPDTVKFYLRKLALMGYDYLELYTEDTYEIDTEPYFGHLRGRYTGAEMREMDAYARKFGIELIPCIQTLAHLNSIFRWIKYRSINDVADILLADCEETDAIIDKMLDTVRKNFTTDKINLCMDEAWLLGAGKYMKLHGYVPRREIMLRHFNKVIDKAREHGFTPSVWNDMFFRVDSGNDYGRPDEMKVSEQTKSAIPADVKLIYWEYCEEDPKIYDGMMKKSVELTPNTAFAGGVYSWAGFAPFLRCALRKIRPAVDACRKYGVKDIMVTSWGDGGSETSRLMILPALYAWSEYVHGNESYEGRENFCRLLFGYGFEELLDIELVNRYVDLSNLPEHLQYYGDTSKYMLYNDPLFGIYDENVPSDAEEYGRRNAERLKELAKRNSPLRYLYRSMSLLSEALISKANLGNRIRAAYETENREELLRISGEIPGIIRAIERFAQAYETQWEKENKPFGFEVQDAHFGGLRRRLEHAARLLADYAVGKRERIEEMEQPRLPSNATVSMGRYNPIVKSWAEIISVCSAV